MKIKIILPLALAITAALVAQPAFAAEYVFTEISSTILTATLDGNPLAVTFVSPDHWTVTNTFSWVPATPPVHQWTEPENSNSVNLVDFSGGATIDIVSDTSLSNLFPVYPDGQQTAVGLIVYGFPLIFEGIYATFNDNAAAVEAIPEPSTVI